MDAVSLLKKDHKTVEDLFKRFEKAGEGSPKMKKKLVDQMIVELSKHAVIEEMLLYPRVRQAIPKEEDTVLESLEEHHVVKWTLDELQKLKPDAERYDAKVRVLMESVRHHVKEEESELFPALKKALKPAELKELGEMLEQAKKLAPNRPHPRSPDSPPGNIAMTPIAKAMDKGRDMLGMLSAAKARGKVKQARSRIGDTRHR